MGLMTRILGILGILGIPYGGYHKKAGPRVDLDGPIALGTILDFGLYLNHLERGDDTLFMTTFMVKILLHWKLFLYETFSQT